MRNKLEALKHAVQELKNGTMAYEWETCTSCNCGIVAQSALCLSADQLTDKIFSQHFNGWKSVCSVTGIPTHEVIKSLISAGFSKEELGELEGICNKSICEEAGIEYKIRRHSDQYYPDLIDGYSTKSVFILYLEAWIRIIEREQQPQIIAEHPAPKMVFQKFESMNADRELIYAN